MSTTQISLLAAFCGLMAAVLARLVLHRGRIPGWQLVVIASAVFFLAGLVLSWEAMRAALWPDIP